MMCYVSYLKTFKSFMMKYTNWFSRPVLDLQHIKKIRWLAVTVLCSMFGMHVCSTVGHIQTCFSHLIFLTSPFKRRKQGYIDNITCKNMERQISLLLFVSFLIKLLFFNWIFFKLSGTLHITRCIWRNHLWKFPLWHSKNIWYVCLVWERKWSTPV